MLTSVLYRTSQCSRVQYRGALFFLLIPELSAVVEALVVYNMRILCTHHSTVMYCDAHAQYITVQVPYSIVP